MNTVFEGMRYAFIVGLLVAIAIGIPTAGVLALRDMNPGVPVMRIASFATVTVLTVLTFAWVVL